MTLMFGVVTVSSLSPGGCMWLHVGETGLKVRAAKTMPLSLYYAPFKGLLKTEADLKVHMNVFTKYDGIPLGLCPYIHHKTTGAIRGKAVEV